MSRDDEKNRRAILARRARFIAAALTATTGCDQAKPTNNDQWAEQRARLKATEEAIAKARGDAGTPPPVADQIPEHRRREAEASREGVDPQRPMVCLTIRAVRQPEGAGPDKTEPEK